MSHEATELCRLLVDEIYGELTSRIFDVLTYHGRLSFGALSLRSQLSSRQLKHGLAVLIQQNLAFWSTTVEGTYYEADWRGAYNLVRRGKLISIVEERHGKAACEIVATLLTLGHATVDTLAEAQGQREEISRQPELKTMTHSQNLPMDSSNTLGASNGTTLSSKRAEKDAATDPLEQERTGSQVHPAVRGSRVNGGLTSTTSPLALASLSTELAALIKAKFLCAVHESHFRSEADVLAEAELEISALSQFKGKPNLATKLEFRDAVDQLLFSWKFGANRDHILKRQAPLDIPRGQKRPLGHMTRPNGVSKRARVTPSMAQVTKTKKRTLLDEDIRQPPKRIRLNAFAHSKRPTQSCQPGMQNGSKDVDSDDEQADDSDAYHSDSGEMTDRIHVDADTVLDVDHAQLDIALRNQHLVRFVHEQIGAQTAQIYATFLRLYEKHLHSCSIKSTIDFSDLWDLRHGPGILTRDIASALTEFDASNCGIGPADPSQINLRSITHAKRDGTHVRIKDGEMDDALSDEEDEDEDLSDFIEDDDQEAGNANFKTSKGSHHSLGIAGPSIKKRDAQANSLVSGTHRTETHRRQNGEHKDAETGGDFHEAISAQPKAFVSGKPAPPSLSLDEYTRQHMLILAEHPCQLVTYILGKHQEPERWTVDFDFVARQMRLSALEETIQDRYGIHALRIIRILQLKGKLDEKGLSSFSLMNPKSMRSVLTAMHEGGHLELQEIPRDNNRQPVKTMFYWFFDEDRCSRKLLEETYKTMANCSRRIKSEREAVQAIIDKANRLDVQGREEEFLSAKEQAEMRTWKQKEEQLLGQLGRLDDLVGVLRDF